MTADWDRSTGRRSPGKRGRLSLHTLSWFGITDGSTLYLQCSTATEAVPIVPYGLCSVLCSDNPSAQRAMQLIADCTLGLLAERKPRRSEDGEGGTYFFEQYTGGQWRNRGCFKPSDEEVCSLSVPHSQSFALCALCPVSCHKAGCINNPRGRTDPRQAMHCGIKPSEGHLREMAAYLLDAGGGGTGGDGDGDEDRSEYMGFHSVPPTIRVEIASIVSAELFHYDDSQLHSVDGVPPIRRKIGSLQQFVGGEVVENLGVQNFAIREVHKIGLLDIRMLNCDRNSGNVLASRNEYGRLELIPIDHGLSMPEQLEITRDSWVWLHWAQSREPFDPFTLRFIQQIDVEHDVQRLKSELNFNDIVFENMRVSHLVLQKCANSGLTLHQIGNIIARFAMQRIMSFPAGFSSEIFWGTF